MRWYFYPVKAFNERIKHFKCIPNKHSSTTFVYVQSQKQHNSISIIDHLYPTRIYDNSFKTYDFNLKLTRIAIGFRGPTIWNKFLTVSEKCNTSIDVFKNNFFFVFENHLRFDWYGNLQKSYTEECWKKFLYITHIVRTLEKLNSIIHWEQTDQQPIKTWSVSNYMQLSSFGVTLSPSFNLHCIQCNAKLLQSCFSQIQEWYWYLIRIWNNSFINSILKILLYLLCHILK